MTLPLEGIIVVEYAYGLSVSYAGLRLADLGATVIKVGRVSDGVDVRADSTSEGWLDGPALFFHTVNRNKEIVALDAGDALYKKRLDELICMAHVFIHNFSVDMATQKGLDYATVQAINPRIIYVGITGYGNRVQENIRSVSDLMLQAVSGLCHTTGSSADPPTPFGLNIGEYLCGQQAVQFIVAALIRAKKTGTGALLELSLFETLIDFQFEFFTTFFESGKKPVRAGVNNANALLSAPYGVYKTRDGFIAIAMMPLNQLNRALNCTALEAFKEDEAFLKRDEIKAVIAEHILRQTSEHWLRVTKALDLWVMPVLDWKEMRAKEGYNVLRMEQSITLKDGRKFITTRCPIRINRQRLFANKPASVRG